jgi:hypothetical protein
MLKWYIVPGVYATEVSEVYAFPFLASIFPALLNLTEIAEAEDETIAVSENITKAPEFALATASYSAMNTPFSLFITKLWKELELIWQSLCRTQTLLVQSSPKPHVPQLRVPAHVPLA